MPKYQIFIFLKAGQVLCLPATSSEFSSRAAPSRREHAEGPPPERRLSQHERIVCLGLTPPSPNAIAHQTRFYRRFSPLSFPALLGADAL